MNPKLFFSIPVTLFIARIHQLPSSKIHCHALDWLGYSISMVELVGMVVGLTRFHRFMEIVLDDSTGILSCYRWSSDQDIFSLKEKETDFKVKLGQLWWIRGRLHMSSRSRGRDCNRWELNVRSMEKIDDENAEWLHWIRCMDWDQKMRSFLTRTQLILPFQTPSVSVQRQFTLIQVLEIVLGLEKGENDQEKNQRPAIFTVPSKGIIQIDHLLLDPWLNFALESHLKQCGQGDSKSILISMLNLLVEKGDLISLEKWHFSKKSNLTQKTKNDAKINPNQIEYAFVSFDSISPMIINIFNEEKSRWHQCREGNSEISLREIHSKLIQISPWQKIQVIQVQHCLEELEKTGIIVHSFPNMYKLFK